MSGRFRAIGVQVCFNSTGDEILCDENDPNLWNLATDEAENYNLTRLVQSEISQHLEHIFAQLVSIGCVRADVLPGNAGGNTPSFFLIAGGGDECVADLERLIVFDETSRMLSGIPGVSIQIQTSQTSIDPIVWESDIDPRALYELLAPIDPEDAVAAWGGSATPERLPNAGEPAEEWLARVAVPASELSQMADRWEMAGRDPELFARYSRPAKDGQPDWLVEGVIAFGVVTLIVGSGAAGKSSACHELLSAASGIAGSKPKTFLGRPIHGRHTTALLCGEEPDWIFQFRQDRHDTILAGCSTMIFAGSADDLKPMLAKLEKAPRGVLVVDPAQTFINGDDTKSSVTSDFYSPLVEFARRSGWAVIVAAHLVKEPAKTLGRMLSSVKGSTVHTDRARMVIAMIDRGNGIVGVGPIKHNFPAEIIWSKLNEEKLYRRDSETFTLVPVDVAAPPEQEPTETDDRVLAAILELNKLGRCVRRTGIRFGLYEAKLPELTGLSRNTIQGAITPLIERGRIVDGADGLVAVLQPDLAAQDIGKE